MSPPSPPAFPNLDSYGAILNTAIKRPPFAPEETELDCLQDQLAAHQRLVSPRPLAILQLLEEGLQQRARNATGRV